MPESKTLAVGDKVRVKEPSRFAGFEGEIESFHGDWATVVVTKSLRENNPVGSEIRPYVSSLEPLWELTVGGLVPVSGEAVVHPAHYGGDTTYEAIKVIEAWGLGFHLGNTVKYISRAGKKNKEKLLEDLKKALWYLQRYITKLEEELSPSSK